MKFEEGIELKYRKAINDAAETIIEKGNETHRMIMTAIRDSEMAVRVEPVSDVKASGKTGVNNWFFTNRRIADEKLSVREALGEVYMLFAAETIDAGPRGTEGTLVHEGRHAYDFAQVIASFSEADEHPLHVFNPTLYELELAAHISAGEYMLLINKNEYISEGLDLLILGRDVNGAVQLWNEGIKCRLRDGYGLTEDGNQGALASELLMLKQR